MKPIEERADVAYMQAIQCVAYRVPRRRELTPAALLLSIALRYGLIGAAATQHLLLTSSQDEEYGVYSIAQAWPELVEEHVRQSLLESLPFQARASVPPLIGQLAYQPVGVTLRLYRVFCPLDRCLEAAAEQFAVDHGKALVQSVPWCMRRKVRKLFREVSAESVQFAKYFFERRQADLEEVPEIALIGE